MHDILCFSRTRRSNSCCSSFGKGTGPTRWNGASEAMILDTWSKRTGMTPCRDKRVRIVIMSMWQRTKNYRLAQGGEWHLHFVVWLNESARITAHAERQNRAAARPCTDWTGGRVGDNGTNRGVECWSVLVEHQRGVRETNVDAGVLS